MKAYISELIQQAVAEISPQEAESVLAVANFDVAYPKTDFGDYATNAAMVMFKNFNTAPAGNPMEFAKLLAEKISILDEQKSFSKVDSVGGFINFTLKDEVLASMIFAMQNSIIFSTPEAKVGEGKKVVFEYSSPNTNKPLHIGHIRNNVYGKACINLLKAIGYDVVSCEIINDRGIHIMKSIMMYQKYGNNETPEQAVVKPDHFVGKFYAMFGQKAAESEEAEIALLEEAQELLRKWEDGDEEIRNVWKKMNNFYFDGARKTYKRECSTFDEVDFESDIYDKGRDLVLAGVESGIFQKEEDGSVSVEFEEKNLGKKYLLRKDGTTIYITQDMYLWDQRNQRHNPDMVFVTTATEQAYHFQVLKKMFELLKYPWAKNFKHLPYEHVYLGRDKMSSRSGNTITADKLYDTVKEKVRDTMSQLERLKGSVDDDKLVEKIAMGAVKYGYLHYEPQTRIYFDIDQTIALEGNTGPYIQYAYARIQSLIHKSGIASTNAKPSELAKPEELHLMRTIIRYESVVAIAAREYKPNLLCNYLYELASSLNTFYANVPVVKEESEQLKEQRISLLLTTATVLKNGLNLLGIEAPEEM